ncbi:hypothetical protein [Pseudoflavitalea rhizosphaerae]|uniref:hypothetical protein n=1 Tax=Pseudoflavitalea rhizosphaerae TaxID=1884793 RepID=UPI000F8C931A|nr:hypothetical protein [Pseudoflavitalea rhizosphaerae]
MKTLLTTNWNLMRVVRLVTGIAGVIYGLISHELLLGIAGIVLVLLGLFNAGCCCSGSSCSVPRQPRKR